MSYYSQSTPDSIAINILTEENFSNWLQEQSQLTKNYTKNSGFTAQAGKHCLLFDSENKLAQVMVVVDQQEYKTNYIAALSLALPEGNYHCENFQEDALVHLGWGMGAYQFTRYKKAKRNPAKLFLPQSLQSIEQRLNAIYLTRDLINIPTEDLGPYQLAAAAEKVSQQFGASYSCIKDETILQEKFPAVYTVGKGSVERPCFIEMQWGDSSHPKITLIGKGVCFDSGGLNIKPDTGMRLMKKDMGGAANVLGLASHIMAAKLPVCLQVLIPAVENSTSGNAMRPGDIIKMRKGLTVEVDNTDAEGRLILADAITYATEKTAPDLLFTFATLTGAARVAVGSEIGAFFCTSDELAADFYQQGINSDDPVWRLPLYQPYKRSLKTAFADTSNTGYPMGGAITAALFLQQFFEKQSPWFHIDIMAWNANVRPAHPEGGEAMGIGAAFNLIAAFAQGKK